MNLHLNVSIEEWMGGKLTWNETTGQWILTGPMRQVLQFISRNHFNYTLIRADDRQWGVYRNNSWTGAMGLLDRNESDLALGPIALTHERSLVSPFTSQLFSDDMSVMSTYSHSDVNIFKPLSQFLNHYLWYCLLAEIFIFSLISSFSNSFRTNKSRLYKRLPSIQIIATDLWTLMAIALLRGNGLTQSNVSRINRKLIILISIASLFVFTMLSALIGMSVITGPEVENIDSLEDLLFKDISPLLQKGSYQMDFFRNNSVSIYREIWKKLHFISYSSFKLNNTIESLNQRQTVIIDGLVHLNGYATHYCKINPESRLYLGKQVFLPTQYVLMTSKRYHVLNPHFHQQINQKVLRLVSSGIFHELMDRLFNNSTKCKVCKHDYSYLLSNIKAFPFTLLDTKPLYYAFLLLTLLSGFVFLSELFLSKCKPFCE